MLEGLTALYLELTHSRNCHCCLFDSLEVSAVDEIHKSTKLRAKQTLQQLALGAALAAAATA